MAKVAKTTKKVRESKTKSVLTESEKAQFNSAKKYELMFILSPMLTEDKRKKTLSELNTLLTERGAEVFHIDDWGKRDLAYKIKKQEEGYYMIYYFTLTDTQSLKDFDQHLRLDQGILRHLIMKREDDYEIRDFTQLEEVPEEPVVDKKTASASRQKSAAEVADKVTKVESNTNSEV